MFKITKEGWKTSGTGQPRSSGQLEDWTTKGERTIKGEGQSRENEQPREN